MSTAPDDIDMSGDDMLDIDRSDECADCGRDLHGGGYHCDRCGVPVCIHCVHRGDDVTGDTCTMCEGQP